VIPSIVRYEQETRKSLKKDRLVALDDKIWRAFGILSNARAISSEERSSCFRTCDWEW